MPSRERWRHALRQDVHLAADLAQLVAQIPVGRVATYGDLARYLGLPAASRWVGQWCVDHRHTHGCLCHRVVRKTGHIGNYVLGNSDEKRRRLVAERVSITADGCVRMDEARWANWHGPRPLLGMLKLQREIAQAGPADPIDVRPQRVAGVDVSYCSARQLGVAAYVESADRFSSQSTVHCRSEQIEFPYIPSLLAFRELPLLLDLLSEVERGSGYPDLIWVDGTGILHPRAAGLATMLGQVLDVPTIGVTKRLLVGRFDCFPDSTARRTAPLIRDVWWRDTITGVAVLGPGTSRRPLFVSPGHRVDLSMVRQLIRTQWGTRRLPAPIYWADRRSRERSRQYTEGSSVTSN